jgi:hypothetical protein
LPFVFAVLVRIGGARIGASSADGTRQIGRVDDVVPVKHIPSLPPAQFHDLAL